MTIETERPFLLAFHKITNIGAARITALHTHFGSLETAWKAREAELRQADLPPSAVTAILRERGSIDPHAELDRLDRAGVRGLAVTDDEYPRLLRHIQNPPPVLYVRGTLLPSDDFSLGIVGTRGATPYGIEMTSRLTVGLVQAGMTIVSGLALGIDTVAHRETVDAGGRTIAVLANGLDSVYPRQNQRLADRIVEQGALVSEYALGAEPLAQNFPARNRIISGLSQGVLVTESPMKSGSLITTGFAADQGRDVFAVPGSATSPKSAGCHWLIRNGATLVTSAAEVLEYYDVERAQAVKQVRMLLPDTPAEQRLYSVITTEPQHVDEIALDSGLPIHEVIGTLLALELKGFIRQRGAQHYVRT